VRALRHVISRVPVHAGAKELQNMNRRVFAVFALAGCLALLQGVPAFGRLLNDPVASDRVASDDDQQGQVDDKTVGDRDDKTVGQNDDQTVGDHDDKTAGDNDDKTVGDNDDKTQKNSDDATKNDGQHGEHK
jgi:hypothetical protein